MKRLFNVINRRDDSEPTLDSGAALPFVAGLLLLLLGMSAFAVDLAARSKDLDSAGHVRSILETLIVPPERRAS